MASRAGRSPRSPGPIGANDGRTQLGRECETVLRRRGCLLAYPFSHTLNALIALQTKDWATAKKKLDQTPTPAKVTEVEEQVKAFGRIAGSN